MSAEQLITEAMALSISERVTLAQALWESITGDVTNVEERETAHEVIRRDAELSSGAVVGRTHEEVLQAARRALGCG